MPVTLRSGITLLGSAGAAALVLVVACNLDGEDATQPIPGLSTPASPGRTVFDAGVAGPGPCATAAAGAACTGGAADCEIGDHADLRCNLRLTCVARVWRPEPTAGRACETGCPATAEPNRPDGCDGPSPGTVRCAYPDERLTCGCAPRIPDAGASRDAGDGGVMYAWTCIETDAGCPRVRPRIGAACVRPMTCDYGACAFDDGVATRCYSGTWIREPRSTLCYSP